MRDGAEDGEAVPNGWATAPLIDLLREPLRNGHSAKASGTSEGIPTLTLTAVTTGDFSEANLKLTVADAERVADLWLQPGDILIERGNTPELVGTAQLYEGPSGYAIFPDLVIRARFRDEVVNRFIAGFLHSTRARTYFQRKAQGIAGSMPKIGQATIEQLQIPVPPPSEQTRIAASVDSYLSRLDAAVAGLERVQANLKRYRASVLKAAVEGRLVPTEAELAKAEGRTYEPASELLARILDERRARWEAAELASMKAKGKPPKDDKWKAKYQEPAAPDTEGLPELPEGWCWATAEALSDASESITYGVVKLGDVTPDGVPTLRSSNVRQLRLDLDYVKPIARRIADGYQRTYLRGGEVVVTIRGTLGGVAVIPGHCVGYNVSREVAVIRLVEPRVGAAVATLIASPLLDSWIKRNTKGNTYVGLNIEDLKALPVPLPPLQEQARIQDAVGTSLAVGDHAVKQANLSLRRTNRLRQSILKWAFEGKLVDQDPTDEPASALLERILAEREATVPAKKRLDPNKTTKAPQDPAASASSKPRRRKKASAA